jgi:putative sigma-54 modulation protein
MKVTYRGVQKELPSKLQEKLDTRFAKLSKLLERRGEKEAHVVITAERHLHKTEITIPFYDHQLIGLGADVDLFTSMSQALDKLETQAVKTRNKWREKRRDVQEDATEEPAARPAVKSAAKTAAKTNLKPGLNQFRKEVKIFPVNHHGSRKPMTIEEAVIELESDVSLNYMVYRDADKECVSVLVRRQDGHFDLIESQ